MVLKNLLFRFGVALTLVTVWLCLPRFAWLPSMVPQGPSPVSAADFTMQTGYYVGNGTSVSIQVGFQPDLVIIKSDISTIPAVMKTSAMPADTVVTFNAAANNYASQITLNASGFTAGQSERLELQGSGFRLTTDMGLSVANIRYQWIAFGGSDCSASGTFCVGSYSGNGSSPRAISTGFQPDMVMIKRLGANAVNMRTASMPSNETSYLANVVRSTDGSLIQSFGTTDFTVGASNNALGNPYYYVAFKNTANIFKEGTYTADNIDDRTVTGVGFQPSMVIVKNATNATANNTYPVFNTNHSYGDSSSHFTATSNAANNIQALVSDGFQVGNSIYTNGSTTDTHYYVAFGGASTPSGSGTFKMASGTYTGNGTTQTIGELDFKPDLVIVKNNANQQGVFTTSLMAGNSTAYFGSASANFEGAIIDLTQSGFIIGNNATVNASGNTYHWQAFGNAFNPNTNTGAADFAIGMYTGSATDNRDITNLPFQPNLVTIKSFNNAGAGVWRSSVHVGDLSSFFAATAESANMIQAINSDGFEIGTGVNVNTSLISYYWFAFKTGSNFSVGEYTGNATDNREITGLGFQPDLVWVKRSTAVNGVFKSSTLAGDATQYFVNVANANDRIQALSSDGFQIGGNQTETNTSTAVYRYAAWKLSTAAVGVPDVPGSLSFTNVGSNSITINWPTANNATSYSLERALDMNGAPFMYVEIATPTGLSYLDSDLASNTTYWYRVRAKNSNGYSVFGTAATQATSTQDTKIQVGSFVGNAAQLSVSNIGFRPDFVMIKSDTAATASFFRTSVMSALPFTKLSFISATADNSTAINNTENVRHTYLALGGSNCSASGTFCVGTYLGNGSNPRTITTGFQPDVVIVKRSTAVLAHFHTASQPANETLFLGATVRDTTGNYVQSFTSDGFVVGTTDNTAGSLYYYVALKNATGFMKEGVYTADNTDNRSITGVGFQPSYVLTKNATDTTAANTNPVFAQKCSQGDYGSFFSATANAVNTIQALETDGFQVGSSVYTNGAGGTNYYIALGGAAANSASGTFKMATGTYTGNGSSQTISGLTFAPDLVIVKSETAVLGVYRTKTMMADQTAYLASATAGVLGGITSLTSDGFTLGNHTTVNQDTVAYHWQAFGNAYNPLTNTGAADFAIGTYMGNGIDNRDIRYMPFQPDFVMTGVANQNYVPVWRSSEHAGDLSGFLGATAETADYIQALNSDGFQVGIGSRNVNYAGYLYHWFAFKEGNGFAVGTYTGNATDNRDITSVGFQPDLVWVKRSTAVNGVFRTASKTGDSTFYFAASVNVADRLQNMLSTGFQVGGNQTETNTNLATYRYATWRNPPGDFVSVTVTSDGMVEYGAVASSRSTLDLGDTQSVQNDGTLTANLNIKTSNAIGGIPWVVGLAPGSDVYMHEYSANGGGAWTLFSSADTYQTLTIGLAPGNSQNFDLRLTVPTTTSDTIQKSLSITIQAVTP